MDENQDVKQNENNYNTTQIKEQDDVVSMWAFMGLQILYCIPCVGLIAAIIIAFAAGNKNIKNHARGYLLLFVIIVVLYVALMALGLGTFIFSSAKTSLNSGIY